MAFGVGHLLPSVGSYLLLLQKGSGGTNGKGVGLQSSGACGFEVSLGTMWSVHPVTAGALPRAVPRAEGVQVWAALEVAGSHQVRNEHETINAEAGAPLHHVVPDNGTVKSTIGTVKSIQEK